MWFIMKTCFFDIGRTLVGSPYLLSFIAKRIDSSQDLAKLPSSYFMEYDKSVFRRLSEIIAIALKKIAIEMNVNDISSQAAHIYEQFFLKEAYLFEDVKLQLSELKKGGY